MIFTVSVRTTSQLKVCMKCLWLYKRTQVFRSWSEYNHFCPFYLQTFSYWISFVAVYSCMDGCVDSWFRITVLIRWLRAFLTHYHDSNKSSPFGTNNWMCISKMMCLTTRNHGFNFPSHTCSLNKYAHPWWFVEPHASIFCYLPFCSLSEKMISSLGACALIEALQVNHSLQELEWVLIVGLFCGGKIFAEPQSWTIVLRKFLTG